MSMLDKYTHMIVWTANLDVLVLEIRLEPRPDPVVCGKPPNQERRLGMRINVTNCSNKVEPTVIGVIADLSCCSNALVIA